MKRATALLLSAAITTVLSASFSLADDAAATTSVTPATQPAPAPESAPGIPMKQYEPTPPAPTIKAPEGVPQEITSPMGNRMTLKFDDEFDAVQDKQDGKPYYDRRKWLSSFWQGDSVRTLIGNAEAQYYTDKEYGGDGKVPKDRRINPFSFEEPGVLTISAVKTPQDLWKHYYMGEQRCFASGVLISDGRFTFEHGYVEGRFKLPNNRGAWPAFWLLGDDPTLGKPDTAHQWPPEVDVFEFFGHRPTKHTCGALSRKGEQPPNKIFWHDLGTLDITQDYHTWGFEWDDKQMVWTFDGQIWAKYDTPPSMNRPMYLLINLAVGGKWYSDEMRQAGTPYKPWEVDESTMPWKMKCDYVRVYQIDK